MARVGSERRGAGRWVTTHAVDATKPERDLWLAQPTVCGTLRKETMPVDRFLAYRDGDFRSHKCQKCLAVLAAPAV